MTLGETLLSRLGEWRPTGSGRQTYNRADAASGWSVSLTIDKNDSFSSKLTELTVERSASDRATKPWADAVAKRATGLMESLRVIEVDNQRDEALLRSDSPTVRGETRAHYELRLQNGRKATLARYAAATEPNAKRQPIPFALTHEVLAKLVDDLTAPV